jgi:hypothetical protein
MDFAIALLLLAEMNTSVTVASVDVAGEWAFFLAIAIADEVWAVFKLWWR